MEIKPWPDTVSTAMAHQPIPSYQAASLPAAETRVIQWVHSGHRPRGVLRGMAASPLAGAAQHPPRLSPLCQIATDPGVRLRILSNLLDECGILPDAQHSLVAPPEQRYVKAIPAVQTV